MLSVFYGQMPSAAHLFNSRGASSYFLQLFHVYMSLCVDEREKVMEGRREGERGRRGWMSNRWNLCSVGWVSEVILNQFVSLGIGGLKDPSSCVLVRNRRSKVDEYFTSTRGNIATIAQCSCTGPGSWNVPSKYT